MNFSLNWPATNSLFKSYPKFGYSALSRY